jgi:transposase
LLYDNASSHKTAIVWEYSKQEKVVELPRPPYLPDLVPLWLYPISKAQKTPCCEKMSIRLFSSVWTVHLKKIMKTHLEIWLKD